MWRKVQNSYRVCRFVREFQHCYAPKLLRIEKCFAFRRYKKYFMRWPKIHILGHCFVIRRVLWSVLQIRSEQTKVVRILFSAFVLERYFSCENDVVLHLFNILRKQLESVKRFYFSVARKIIYTDPDKCLIIFVIFQ